MIRAAIYHNPRCSKSRQTLALLEERGCDVEVIEYLKTPPSATRLRELLDRLGLKPAELIRRKESRWKELGIDIDTAGDDELVAAMVGNPVLIERPIVVVGDAARIGRPPENVLELLAQ